MSTETIFWVAYSVGAIATFTLLVVGARREWFDGEMTADGAFTAGASVIGGAAIWPLIAVVASVVAFGKTLTGGRR